MAQAHGQNGVLLLVPQHRLDPHDINYKSSLESWAGVGPQLILCRAHEEEEDTSAGVREFSPFQDYPNEPHLGVIREVRNRTLPESQCACSQKTPQETKGPQSVQ